MIKPFSRIIPLVIILFLASAAHGQDVEQIVKAPALTGNGGVSMSHIANYSPDSVSHLTPYAYYLSGNINFKLFGVVDLPFSFAYTNNQTTSHLPQPFNRFSLSPSYRWITTHMGYSSMNFSPYTLTGHEFFGGGIELSPEGPVKVAAMYGQFRRAVNADTLGREPSYRRMGGGFKVDYTHKKFDVAFNLLKIKDEDGSIAFAQDDSTYIAPQDNLSGSVAVNFKMMKSVTLSTEYGISAVNRDISRADSVERGFSDRLLEQNGDLAVYHAFKAAVSQTSAIGQIGATYERVAPNYNTFGAYYFTNDFENITANFSTNVIKWLNFSIEGGYQRDNLEAQKTNTSKRAIFSSNASATLTKRLTLGLNFSNVQSFVHIKDIYDQVTETNEYQNIDTLRFTQLNLMSSMNVNYVVKSTQQQRQNLNVGFSYQEASEQQNDDARFVGNRIYNSVASYQFSLIPTRLNISGTVNHNHNSMPQTDLDVLSYNLSVQKSFWEQFKAALIGTYSHSFNNLGSIANITNLRFTGGYTLLKRHSFSLGMAMLNNKSIKSNVTQYSANFAYSYIFNFSTSSKSKDIPD
jgi:hypothetical protein